MLLYFIGISSDPVALAILFFFFLVFSLPVFLLSRMLLKRVLRGRTSGKINVLSIVLAVTVTPILLFLFALLVIYINSGMEPSQSEDVVQSHYEMMEEDLAKDIRIGMSKRQIVELLGENDTTKISMEYDLSMPWVNEKYIMELHFDNGRLTRYKRKK